MERQEFEQEVEKIKETVSRKEIHISRVPKKIYAYFKQFSEEEFEGDYGMALKFLWDFYAGLIPKGYENLELDIGSLKSRVSALETQSTEQKKRKRLDGTEVF